MKKLILGSALLVAASFSSQAKADGISIGYRGDHSSVRVSLGDWFSVGHDRLAKVRHPHSCKLVKSHRHGHHYYQSRKHRHDHRHKYSHYSRAKARLARWEAAIARKEAKKAKRDWKKAERKADRMEEKTHKHRFRGRRDFARRW